MAETADIAVIDGEDIVDVSPWEFDSIVGEGGCTLALDAGAAQHGSGGYKFTGDGVNNYAYGVKTFSEVPELFVRFYVLIPAAYATSGASDITHTMYLMDGVDAKFFLSFEQSPGRWRFYNAPTGGFTFIDTNYSRDVKHYIDAQITKGSGADGIFRVWVDGDLIHEETGINLSAIGVDSLRIGNNSLNNLPGNGHYIYFDDIILSTTGPIGVYAGLPGISDALSLSHTHTIDNLLLSLSIELIINDLTHTQTLDNVVLTQAHTLVVNDATHTQKVGSLLLPQKHLLALQDLLHAHSLDQVTFTTVHGYVTVAFTGKRASITYTGKTAGIDFVGKRPNVDFEGG